MKKLLVTIIVVLTFIACDSGDSTSTPIPIHGTAVRTDNLIIVTPTACK